VKRRRYLLPYIRRRSPKDKSESLKVAYRMAYLGENCVVLVQRGYPHLVMWADRTKRDLLRSIVHVRRPNARSFRQWANRFARHARSVTFGGVE
jgi:hypothetical protein